MIRSVLLAVDGSPAAAVATKLAVWLCGRLGATLHGLYVIDRRLVSMAYGDLYVEPEAPTNPFFSELKARLAHRGEVLMDEVRRQAAAAGISCRTTVVSGVPAERILSEGTAHDLLVLGRHERAGHPTPPRHLGSVAARVARAARQPVLLAGRTFVPLCRIVLAYEGSPHARAAMRHAVGLAADLTLPLVVLSIHKQAPEYLAQVAHYAADYGVALSTLALRGDPPTALVSALTEGDLLAMGAFGQGRVREWLLGSTTEAMLRLSPQPILLCHLP